MEPGVYMGGTGDTTVEIVLDVTVLHAQRLTAAVCAPWRYCRVALLLTVIVAACSYHGAAPLAVMVRNVSPTPVTVQVGSGMPLGVVGMEYEVTVSPWQPGWCMTDGVSVDHLPATLDISSPGGQPTTITLTKSDFDAGQPYVLVDQSGAVHVGGTPPPDTNPCSMYGRP